MKKEDKSTSGESLEQISIETKLDVQTQQKSNMTKSNEINSKKQKKRVSSANAYIDSLSSKYSKLLVVKDDLYIKKDFSSAVSPKDVSSLFDNLLDNRRGKPSIFKDNIGYMAKLEYTKDRGAHLHTLFFFDGNKVQKDAHKGKEIGDYWNNEITDGKGSYNNCNMNDYKDNYAIGMIEHTNKDKIDLLKNVVVKYLAKDTQNVKDANCTDVVAFRRGLIPKKKSNAGRPRNIGKDSTEEVNK